MSTTIAGTAVKWDHCMVWLKSGPAGSWPGPGASLKYDVPGTTVGSPMQTWYITGAWLFFINTKFHLILTLTDSVWLA